MFYTDGVVEAPNPDGELFGLHRLDDTISAKAGNPGDLIGGLRSAVETFSRGVAATDDQTMITACVE